MNKILNSINRLNSMMMLGITGLTGLLGVLWVILVFVKGGELAKLEAEMKKLGVNPEMVLAKRDGKPLTPDSLRPYTQSLDALKAKCRESRTEIFVMTSTLVKAEHKAGGRMTNQEGLQLFRETVESGFRKYPAQCSEAQKSLISAYKQ